MGSSAAAVITQRETMVSLFVRHGAKVLLLSKSSPHSRSVVWGSTRLGRQELPQRTRRLGRQSFVSVAPHICILVDSQARLACSLPTTQAGIGMRRLNLAGGLGTRQRAPTGTRHDEGSKRSSRAISRR